MSESLFFLTAPLTLLWLGGWVAASVLHRRRRGKPIFPSAPADAVFLEKKASGASKKNILTVLGGASGCLIVAVTPSHLMVRPMFPFNLMFLPEVYGLEFEIPLRSLRAVDERDTILGRVLEIEFDSEPKTARIELRLKDAAGFLRAIGRPSRS